MSAVGEYSKYVSGSSIAAEIATQTQICDRRRMKQGGSTELQTDLFRHVDVDLIAYPILEWRWFI